MQLAEIDKPLLLSVLRKVEKRGAIETARRIEQRVAAIYRYANAEGAGVENPATDINDALTPLPPAKRYPALADIDAIRTMIGDIDHAGPRRSTASQRACWRSPHSVWAWSDSWNGTKLPGSIGAM